MYIPDVASLSVLGVDGLMNMLRRSGMSAVGFRVKQRAPFPPVLFFFDELFLLI